jgi:hypothetical protein
MISRISAVQSLYILYYPDATKFEHGLSPSSAVRDGLCTYSSTCGLTPEDEVCTRRADVGTQYFTQTYYWTPRRDRAGSRYALSEPRRSPVSQSSRS